MHGDRNGTFTDAHPWCARAVMRVSAEPPSVTQHHDIDMFSTTKSSNHLPGQTLAWHFQISRAGVILALYNRLCCLSSKSDSAARRKTRTGFLSLRL